MVGSTAGTGWEAQVVNSTTASSQLTFANPLVNDHAGSSPVYLATALPAAIKVTQGIGGPGAAGLTPALPETGGCVIDKKIFVSGLAGFLGAHIAREGLARGWEVTGVDSMLSPDRQCSRGGAVVAGGLPGCPKYSHLLKDADVVYHCAAAPYEGLSVFSPQVVYAEHAVLDGGPAGGEHQRRGEAVHVRLLDGRYGHGKAPFTEDSPLPRWTRTGIQGRGGTGREEPVRSARGGAGSSRSA